MFIETFTLDETYNARMIDMRLRDYEPYNNLRSPMVRRLLCIAVGEWLRDVKGMNPSMDGRRTFSYTISERDIDTIVDLMQTELKEYSNGK